MAEKMLSIMEAFLYVELIEPIVKTENGGQAYGINFKDELKANNANIVRKKAIMRIWSVNE